MFKSIFFVLFLVVSSYSEPSASLLPDDIQKCSSEDSKCLMQLAQTLMYSLADNGLPEMGIPQMDPMPIKNETVSVFGMLDMTMVDGFGEGMKTCKLKSFDVNMDTRITKFDMICDVVTVQGAYDIKSAPFVDKMLGNYITGNGHGSVMMENLIMNVTVPFKVEMHDDGEIYLVPVFENVDYSYEMDKATFKASSCYIGILQMCPMVTSFLNRNWNYAMEAFSRPFSYKGVSLVYENTKGMFEKMPASSFISDDLTRYLEL